MFRTLQEKIESHKLFVMTAVVILAMLPISFIGWQVHYYFLYELGLPHLMSWAIPYWIAEMLVVAFYGVALAAGYYMTTWETWRRRWTILLLGITPLWQWGCGLFDWLWFLIHALMGHIAEFPALGDIWWWNPYYWYLGINWTTAHHIVYTIILEVVFIGMWVAWHYRVNE